MPASFHVPGLPPCKPVNLLSCSMTAVEGGAEVGKVQGEWEEIGDNTFWMAGPEAVPNRRGPWKWSVWCCSSWHGRPESWNTGLLAALHGIAVCAPLVRNQEKWMKLYRVFLVRCSLLDKKPSCLIKKISLSVKLFVRTWTPVLRGVCFCVLSHYVGIYCVVSETYYIPCFQRF